ncbi:MAG: agmatinase [Calditrichota bacterium]
MAKKTDYRPLDAMVFPRFEGIRTFMRLPHVTDLQGVDFAIAGVPFDTGGTYRVGARFGPGSIREHSMLLRPYHPFLDVEIFKHCSGVDYGDLPITPGYLPESHAQITEGAREIIKHDLTPIFLGGDHSVSLPLLRAIHEKHGPVALIQFDSHSDLWHGYFGTKDTHGTPFRRALEENLIIPERSVQIGLRGPLYDKADFDMTREAGMLDISGPDLHEMGIDEAVNQIVDWVGDTKTYLTFDIDFVDPTFAPGTGTPEVGGFSGYESQALLRGLKDLNIIGFDLVEVMPAYDPANITSLLAANLIYEFLAIIALRHKTGGSDG